MNSISKHMPQKWEDKSLTETNGLRHRSALLTSEPHPPCTVCLPRSHSSKAMGEVVNVLVAVAVIVLVVRWASSGVYNSPCIVAGLTSSFPVTVLCNYRLHGYRICIRARQEAKRAQVHHQRQQFSASDRRMSPRRWCVCSRMVASATHFWYQVETIHSMFPDIPR